MAIQPIERMEKEIIRLEQRVKELENRLKTAEVYISKLEKAVKIGGTH
jgi:predicted  nucleic acid-binding Zn-ribbon protein